MCMMSPRSHLVLAAHLAAHTQRGHLQSRRQRLEDHLDARGGGGTGTEFQNDTHANISRERGRAEAAPRWRACKEVYECVCVTTGPPAQGKHTRARAVTRHSIMGGHTDGEPFRVSKHVMQPESSPTTIFCCEGERAQRAATHKHTHRHTATSAVARERTQPPGRRGGRARQAAAARTHLLVFAHGEEG